MARKKNHQPERRQRATDMFTPVTPKKEKHSPPTALATPISERSKRPVPNPLFTPSKRMRSESGGKSRPVQIEPDENDEDDDNDDDDEVIVVRSSNRIRPSGHNADSSAQGSAINTSDDESDVRPQTPRRRLKKASSLRNLPSSGVGPEGADTPEASEDDNASPEPSARRSRDVDDEVLEDARDLDDTEVQSSRLRDRENKTRKTPAQKRLEELRARRAGKTVPTTNSDESSSEVVEDNSTQDDWGLQRRTQPTIPDNDDEDFIDDQDEIDEAEWRTEMPIEHTSYLNLKADTYFKDVVEWMVHRKLNPAFKREDQLYTIAFRKIDDEAKGFAGSKFTSSIWRPLFHRALRARPDFNDTLDGSTLPHIGCDACGNSTHPAPWRLTFSGGAYHPDSLEPLKDEEDDDEDDDEDADARSHDVEGNRLPTQGHEFRVGRHCKSNAFIAHSLLHWRWHLNQWVLGWLEAEGYTTPARIVAREAWSLKRRTDFANRVVDEMETKREIKALRRDFKNRLEEARSKKAAAFGRPDEVNR